MTARRAASYNIARLIASCVCVPAGQTLEEDATYTTELPYHGFIFQLSRDSGPIFLAKNLPAYNILIQRLPSGHVCESRL